MKHNIIILYLIYFSDCISVKTNLSVVAYGGNLPEHENMLTSEFLCLPLVTITLLVFLAIVGSIFCICRLRSRNSKCNSSTCSIDLKEEVDSKCLEVEEFKYQDDLKKEKANVKDIVLLYTKESKPFMKMMSDFRNALERCVKCHVIKFSKHKSLPTVLILHFLLRTIFFRYMIGMRQRNGIMWPLLVGTSGLQSFSEKTAALFG